MFLFVYVIPAPVSTISDSRVIPDPEIPPLDPDCLKDLSADLCLQFCLGPTSGIRAMVALITLESARKSEKNPPLRQMVETELPFCIILPANFQKAKVDQVFENVKNPCRKMVIYC
ncbi:hypothetical protein L1987_37871 [Smallanthus sonchifolius]|uniref:Uncharacterized protein n=1 Tax=Smallanthus sonchifolius TaxID=185202 RepID=A0ACB9HK47_9ASTR|nr:hypothetical protein L1987_37871 [Smallanthus sonchifolius]